MSQESVMVPVDLDDESGLRFFRRFTREGVDPYDEVEWQTFDAVIKDGTGSVFFEQHGVEFPSFWSQQAVSIVSQKYFYGRNDVPGERESSLRQLIDRVVGSITAYGDENGYFCNERYRDAFEAELTYLLLHQKFSFNSPVWFNIGTPEKQQGSACFINEVYDDMGSIMELANAETMIFKCGSGSGVNMSRLRSKHEPLSGGGKASGPVSFMKGYDAFAGIIKSGGKTRRAAKMVILDVDHPDIQDFVQSKVAEEKKAYALIDAGYDSGFNVEGGAYESVYFQNANHSVRVSDDFMQAVSDNGKWQTTWRTDYEEADPPTYDAKTLFDEMAQAAWECGDPGIQYDDTIHKWHTAKGAGRQRGSNPCSEYLFLDNTACNLGSLNLLKFRTPDGLDVEEFQHAVRVAITAMDILVDYADYPIPQIADETRKWRTLGLGYTNLGAYLMSHGMPYDSDEGRQRTSEITALMCGTAYNQSARIAGELGQARGFEEDDESQLSMLEVLRLHRDKAGNIPGSGEMSLAAWETFTEAVDLAVEYGVRNAQTTVLAPTGTISFMMDCDTTGVEPELALVKYKKLVGGGSLKIVNKTVPMALEQLGYSEVEVSDIVDYIEANDTIAGAPHLRDDDLAVFDCSFPTGNSDRAISWKGHIRMMAAAQPFISGAISKTVNMPNSATVEDIRDAYMMGWELGLKALAIYRNGCKRSQPLSTQDDDAAKILPLARVSERERLPETRQAVTHKFSIGGHEGYLTVGLYNDGRPGEIFVVMSKQGSTIAGLVDAFATSISLNLQYGVPLDVLCAKFKHSRFEPSGFTNHDAIRIATSVVDYLFRWLEHTFINPELPLETHPGTAKASQVSLPAVDSDAPFCTECGGLTVRAGSCYSCQNCGASTGCG